MFSNKKVLDYHDVLLYENDLLLLEDDEWLNDQARVQQPCCCMSQMFCAAQASL